MYIFNLAERTFAGIFCLSLPFHESSWTIHSSPRWPSSWLDGSWCQSGQRPHGRRDQLVSPHFKASSRMNPKRLGNVCPCHMKDKKMNGFVPALHGAHTVTFAFSGQHWLRWRWRQWWLSCPITRCPRMAKRGSCRKQRIWRVHRSQSIFLSVSF